MSTKKSQQQPEAPAVQFFVERAVQCSHCGGTGRTPNPLYGQLQEARKVSGEAWLSLAGQHRVDPRNVQPTRPCSKCDGWGYIEFERVTLAEAMAALGIETNVPG